MILLKNMKQNLFKNLFFIIVIFITACNDIIDLPVPIGGTESVKVIQGVVAKTKSIFTATVYISNSSTANSFSSFLRVISVVIENNKGQTLKLIDGIDGSYIASVPLNSQSFETGSGIKYKLIVVDFQNNKYESGFEEIIDVPTLSNPKFKVEERVILSNVIGLDKAKFLTTSVDINKQPNSGTLYKFDYLISYAITEGIVGQPRGRTCYVTNLDELKVVSINETKNLSPDKFKNYPTYETMLDSKYAEQAYVNIIIGTITNSTREYFEELKFLKTKNVSIFQPQGDRSTSNLKTLSNSQIPVLGYFYGSYQDTARMRILASEVGNPAHICPTEVNMGICNYTQCCDCLRLKGSSLMKPPFWK
jgi:hypothetical protein